MAAQKTLDAVLALLHQQPGLTATEIAAQAGLGRSTAGKALAELERQERAHRILPTPGTESGQPQPARWFLLVDTPESLAIAEIVQQQPARDASAPDDGAADANPDDELRTAPETIVTPASRTQPPRERGAVVNTDPSSSPGAACADVEGGPRLRKGELRALVLERLNADLDAEHTPTALSKVLGRSSGAISNALVRLCLDGQAVETSSRPRRYGAAPGTRRDD